MQKFLFEKQAALQSEADQIVRTLELSTALELIGTPIRVGSSALGLMVRRDIDITVVCKALDDETLCAIAALTRDLIANTNIGAVRYRNDASAWNKDPEGYPDGLYLGITFRLRPGEIWNLDIWFIDEPDRQPDLKHIETIPPLLNDEIREAILGIKGAFLDNTKIPSITIYDCVIGEGVRTAEEFNDWLQKRKSDR